MRLDQQLLEALGQESQAVLHLYEWQQDSATYGYFLKPSDFLNMEGVNRRKLDLARRPTGGGIIFHVWDMAFSVLVPAQHPAFSLNTLDNYAFVNKAVLRAVQEFLKVDKPLSITPTDLEALDCSSQRFCMAQPTKYDVILEGRKIAGAAQRKTKQGFLHQGTIALIAPPQDYLEDVLLPGTRVAEAMKRYTQPLVVDSDPREVKHILGSLIYKYLKEVV